LLWKIPDICCMPSCDIGGRKHSLHVVSSSTELEYCSSDFAKVNFSVHNISVMLDNQPNFDPHCPLEVIIKSQTVIIFAFFRCILVRAKICNSRCQYCCCVFEMWCYIHAYYCHPYSCCYAGCIYSGYCKASVWCLCVCPIGHTVKPTYVDSTWTLSWPST